MGKLGGTLVKAGAVALAAYAGYLAYNKFVKKTDSNETDDYTDIGFNYDESSDSFRSKIKRAAQRQIDKL